MVPAAWSGTTAGPFDAIPPETDIGTQHSASGCEMPEDESRYGAHRAFGEKNTNVPLWAGWP